MVMIGTATLMIILSLHGNYLRWRKLQESCPDHLKPVELMWPMELKERLKTCEEYEKQAGEREPLRMRAKRFGVVLDESATIDEWRDLLENHAKIEVLKQRAEKQKALLGLHDQFALGDINSHPKIWHLGLMGLATVQVEQYSVMKYELSQATAWLMGISKLSECGLFCPVQVTFEEAQTIADRLSLSMNMPACYTCDEPKCYNSCTGWKLPGHQLWLTFRGDTDQKWDYIAWPQNSPLQPTGKKSPNENRLHDIIGNSLEWSEVGEGLGTVDMYPKKVEKEYIMGVRLYRVKGRPDAK